MRAALGLDALGRLLVATWPAVGAAMALLVLRLVGARIALTLVAILLLPRLVLLALAGTAATAAATARATTLPGPLVR